MKPILQTDTCRRRSSLSLLAVACILSLLSAFPAHAQQYVVENMLGDSAIVSVAVREGDAYVGSTSECIANGETVTFVEKAEYDRLVVDHKGRKYLIDDTSLVFSKDNAEGAEDTVLSSESKRKHSLVGRFFYTAVPSWLVLGLNLFMLVVALITVFWVRSASVRRAILYVIPLVLLASAAIEIIGYLYVNSDLLWWCSYERLGFVKSISLLFLFGLAVVIQLFIGFFYTRIVEDATGSSLSMKPALVGFALALPLPIVVAVILAIAGKQEIIDTVFTVLFLLTIAVTIMITLVRNVRAIGKFYGVLYSLFVLVYAVGMVVAAGLLLVAFIQLFWAVLIACGIAFAVMVVINGRVADMPPSSSKPAQREVYTDCRGREFSSQSEALNSTNRIYQNEK